MPVFFDGNSAFLRILHKTILNIGSNFTIQIKYKPIGPLVNRATLTKGNFLGGNTTDEFEMRSASGVSLKISSNGTNVGDRQPSQGGFFLLDTLFTATLVYDAANPNATRWRLYQAGAFRNGAVIGTIASPAFATIKDWILGANLNTSGNPINAREMEVHELIMWSRSLTGSIILGVASGEVAAMVGADPRSTAPANLQCYLMMGGPNDVFPIIKDESGNGNHGIMVNMSALDLQGGGTNRLYDDPNTLYDDFRVTYIGEAIFPVAPNRGSVTRAAGSGRADLFRNIRGIK